MGDEIANPFPNFNGATVEVWECLSNFIPYFTNWTCGYLAMGFKLIHVVKGATGWLANLHSFKGVSD